jgi:hypothetical protein
LAARFETLPEYPLATIPQKKRELAARGVDVIDLGAGDADLAPPPKAIEAIANAAHQPSMHRYGFGLGLVSFRETIAAWMRKRFGSSSPVHGDRAAHRIEGRDRTRVRVHRWARRDVRSRDTTRTRAALLAGAKCIATPFGRARIFVELTIPDGTLRRAGSST